MAGRLPWQLHASSQSASPRRLELVGRGVGFWGLGFLDLELRVIKSDPYTLNLLMPIGIRRIWSGHESKARTLSLGFFRTTNAI